MLSELRNSWPILLLALITSPSLQSAEGPFIEVTAEVQADVWDDYFFRDPPGTLPIGRPKSIFHESSVARCVFGRETWMIQSAGRDWELTYWFTGTNILEQLELEKGSLPAGSEKPRSFDSLDGNPGRPVRVVDVFGFNLPSKFFLLAFCSAPTLRRNPHTTYPPSDFWKRYSIGTEWLEKADLFKDSLGLPNNLKLSLANNQLIFRYQVHESTNMLGWNVPLEFYGVQYVSSQTNVWQTYLTYKGRVTSIGPAKEPRIPTDVVKVAKE